MARGNGRFDSKWTAWNWLYRPVPESHFPVRQKDYVLPLTVSRNTVVLKNNWNDTQIVLSERTTNNQDVEQMEHSGVNDPELPASKIEDVETQRPFPVFRDTCFREIYFTDQLFNNDVWSRASECSCSAKYGWWRMNRWNGETEKFGQKVKEVMTVSGRKENPEPQTGPS